MTTTSPDWFPTWPASWPDLEDVYTQTIPRQFPEGLYDDVDSDEYADIQAIGVVFSWIAQGSEWIKRRIFPQFDDDAMFLHLHEEAFGLVKRATTTLRQNAVIAYMRYMRGTATKEQVQAILAPAFNTEDPNEIAFSYATLAQVVAANPDTQEGYNQVLHTLFIYHTGNNVPDWDILRDSIRSIKPTWQVWEGGSYQYTKYNTQGGYNIGCYT